MDEDEVEFLDTVLESTRAREAAVQRETAEELEHFRKQQEKVEKVVGDEGKPEVEEEQWASKGKKRKKSHAKESLIGIKLRKTSSAAEDSKKTEAKEREPLPKTGSSTDAVTATTSSNPATGPAKEIPAKKSPSPPTAGLGLAAYSSDEDD